FTVCTIQCCNAKQVLVRCDFHRSLGSTRKTSTLPVREPLGLNHSVACPIIKVGADRGSARSNSRTATICSRIGVKPVRDFVDGGPGLQIFEHERNRHALYS